MFLIVYVCSFVLQLLLLIPLYLGNLIGMKVTAPGGWVGASPDSSLGVVILGNGSFCRCVFITFFYVDYKTVANFKAATYLAENLDKFIVNLYKLF